MSSIIVTGTDTGIGKTVFSAALVAALGATYWKPVQSGLDEATDSQTVCRLGRVPGERLLPELYRLKTPVSPHLSAQLDGITLDRALFVLPEGPGPLVVEGAGGLLVPLTEDLLFADVFASWQRPTILCARTDLGTINHTLLSIEAMRARSIPIAGVAFQGVHREDTEATICRLGNVRRLGRLPFLTPLAPDSLADAFRQNFDLTYLGSVLND